MATELNRNDAIGNKTHPPVLVIGLVVARLRATSKAVPEKETVADHLGGRGNQDMRGGEIRSWTDALDNADIAPAGNHPKRWAVVRGSQLSQGEVEAAVPNCARGRVEECLDGARCFLRRSFENAEVFALIRLE